MKISQYAVKNYQLTLVIAVMVALVGLSTILTMPRSEDPDLKSSAFPIVIVYNGASTKDIEELVVDPIEKRVYALEDIKQIKTSIKDGLAIVKVEYDYSSNMDEKYQELVREVNTLRNTLPQDLNLLEVRKIIPSDVNIVQIGLISENAPREMMKKAAEDLQDLLEKIPSLKNVEIAGMPQQTVRIDLFLDKMAQMHVPLAGVSNAIQGEMVNLPGGSVVEGSKSFNIRTSGNYSNLDEIKNTIVSSKEGKNVLLKDVARVYYSFATDNHITRLNGHRAVFVMAAQKPGKNISDTQNDYLPVIELFKKQLPDNIELQLSFEQADHVNRRLTGLGIDFIIAILLVSVTLLPLGFRAAVIVMISIPISLAIGIVLINAMGYSLNQFSIVGLVVALGLLVDDSIVVVENIERWLLEGHSPLQATLKATSQIGTAVVACTVTLIIAFLPIVFLPEVAGEFIRSLPMAVISCILASMAVSLTIVPFLSSRILKNHAGHPDGNMFLRSFKKIISKSYAPLLDLALKWPKLTMLITVTIFGGSLLLFPVIGFSLFPASEKPQFLVNVITPLQSSLAYTDSITHSIEKELKTLPEIKNVASNVGKGNPQVYYNVIPQNERIDFAELFVQLDEKTSPSRKLEIIEELRGKWTPFEGAKVEVKNFEQGAPGLAPIEIRLLGENLDTLKILAQQVENMLKNTEGTMYVNNPVAHLKSDMHMIINKEKARALGVPTLEIDRTVRMAVGGIHMGTFINPGKEGDEIPVMLTVPRPSVPSLSALNNLFISTETGGAVPLSQFTEMKLLTVPVSIDHFNKTRTVSITAQIKKGYLTDNITTDTEAKMKQMKLPAGYRFEMGGEAENRSQSFGGFGTLLLVTLFLFIAVLIMVFKTFKSTLIVLSVIPLGIVGAVLALLVTGNSLSFIAVIGIIALAGIEVKNTILLVDFTNQLRQEGMALDVAIKEAGEIRFLPIILTTLTAIGGLVPIAISTNPLIAPLAIVMIGGLISSTLLSRIVTPVLYKLIPPAVEVENQAVRVN